MSASTRNIPDRLDQSANVYLASAELASVTAVLGKLPNVEEYMQYAKHIGSMSSDIYRHLNFDKIGEYDKSSYINPWPSLQERSSPLYPHTSRRSPQLGSD